MLVLCVRACVIVCGGGQAFVDAYWLFNSVRVYQWSASASVPSSANRVTSPVQWLAADLL
jgi:hypothetical protein